MSYMIVISIKSSYLLYIIYNLLKVLHNLVSHYSSASPFVLTTDSCILSSKQRPTLRQWAGSGAKKQSPLWCRQQAIQHSTMTARLLQYALPDHTSSQLL